MTTSPYTSLRKWRNFRDNLGANIKAARQAQDLCLEQFADRLGISVEQVVKYENGRAMMNIYMFYRLAEALRIPPAMLIK